MIVGFSGPQAAKITGVNYKTLDYWARTGLIKPSIRDARGTGTRRIYSLIDLVALKTVSILRERGLSLQKLRRAVERLRELAPDGVTNSEVLARHYLVTDGNDVYVVESPDVLLSLLQGGQLVLALWLGKMASNIIEAAKRETPAIGNMDQLETIAKAG